MLPAINGRTTAFGPVSVTAISRRTGDAAVTRAPRPRSLSHVFVARAVGTLPRRRLRAPVVAAGFAAASVVIAVTWPPWTIATATTLSVLAVAADVDRRQLRLPDSLVGLAAVPLAVAVLGSGVVGRTDVFGSMMLGSAFLAGPIAGLHLLSPAAMGFGDVKLAVVLGAAVGVIEPSLSLVVLCAASGTAGTWGVLRRRRAVAFGPFLVLAAAVVLVAAAWFDVEAASWR